MLSSGYLLRGTLPADIDGAQEVVDAAMSALVGEPRRGEFEVATASRDARIDLGTNTWVVEAPGGSIVGFAMLFWDTTAQGEAEVHVHPRHLGQGVGGALLDAVGGRAVELAAEVPPEIAPRLHVWCPESRERRRAALLERGFRAVRESYLMRIDFGDETPAPAPLPAGLEVRPFAVGTDEEAVYAATEEAFADHFLFNPASMEQWRVHHVDHPRFDPSLWLVAWEGDRAAGEVLLFVDEYEAYVDSLSVRRAWRGRGLGLALLTRGFAAAYERGLRKVRLGVDARNPTGALALYCKAGMHAEHREVVYARDLR